MRKQWVLIAVISMLTTGGFATVPRAQQVAYDYRGAALAASNRASLEKSLNPPLRATHAMRVVVTISDRVVGAKE